MEPTKECGKEPSLRSRELQQVTERKEVQESGCGLACTLSLITGYSRPVLTPQPAFPRERSDVSSGWGLTGGGTAVPPLPAALR